MMYALRRLLCVVCLMFGPVTEARPLGRLFFTDEERAALDRPAPPPVAREEPDVPARQSLRLDGLLLIGARPARWFVNGEALDREELRARGLPVPLQRPPYGLSMPGLDRSPTVLRAGQSADIDAAGRALMITPDTAIHRRPAP